MFDLRYHVASLAAVFLALIIGILVGVGISSRTDVEGTERRVLEERIADLQRQLDDATANVDLLRRQQEATDAYVADSYGVVMNGRLRGMNVALLFIGHADPDLLAIVEQTLRDASGPALVRRRALELPVDAAEIQEALGADGADTSLEEVGRRLGAELRDGGETPTWDSLERVLVEDSGGTTLREADAVVVVHTAQINDNATERLVSGIYGGLAAADPPAVGIERTAERPSRVDLFRRNGLSSVDSVDTQLGRLALALLLAGGEEGQYGLKSTATDVLPALEPLPLAPPPGG